MSDVTVTQFAETIGVPVERLLSQLQDAGVKAMGADEVIGDEDKIKLLDYLREKHGTEKAEAAAEAGPKKITLKRRTTSELKVGGTSASKGKTVTVEVRKKRTYVKRSVVVAEEDKRIDQEVAQRLEQQLEVEARQRAEAEARQKAEDEARRKAEEEARRKAEEEEARRKVEEVAVAVPAEQPTEAAPAVAAPKRERVVPEKKPQEEARPAAKKEKAKKGRKDRHEEGEGELHIALDKSGRRKKKGGRGKPMVSAGAPKHGFEKPTAPIIHEVSIPETLTLGELAQKMSVKAAELIKAMMKMGSIVTLSLIHI